MSTRPGRSATQQLTRIGLVLAPRRIAGARLAQAAVLLAAFALGAGGNMLYRGELRWDGARLARVSAEVQTLQQRMEQSRLALGLSEARGKELERQIDALNQRLRENQEELTFFRKAGDGKH